MQGVNREGFTELFDGGDAGGYSQENKSVKYRRLTSQIGDILLLTESSIVFVHGLRGHPFRTWASNQQAGDEHAVGPSSLRQHIRSLFKSNAPLLESNSTQKAANPLQQQVFWPKEFLAKDIPQARVWTYGYDADVISGLFQANNKNSISGHGRDLKTRLERDIDNKVDLIFFEAPE